MVFATWRLAGDRRLTEMEFFANAIRLKADYIIAMIIPDMVDRGFVALVWMFVS